MIHEMETKKYPIYDNFSYMTSKPGIYIIGDARGKPLIKNSINSGYEVMAGLDKVITYEGHVGDKNAYDVVIIGAGPAGLSAAIEAENRGIKYIILEQGIFANTIQSMPNSKKIFAVPKDIDARGELWFQECSKEELINKWSEQIKYYNLNIRSGIRIVDVKDYGEYFRCITARGEYFTARYVIIATGDEGNPKRICIDGENFSKVENFLIDSESVSGEDIIVYGAGDSASEVALALCDKNNVKLVTVDHKWSNAKKRYIEKINEKIAQGRIEMFFSTRISHISEFEATLENTVNEMQVTIKNTKIYSMIGRESPSVFFEKIGLKLSGLWDVKRFIKFLSAFIISFLIFSFVFGFFPFKNLHNKVLRYRKAVPIKIWFEFEEKGVIKNKPNHQVFKEPVADNARLVYVDITEKEATIVLDHEETGFRNREKVRFSFVLTPRITEEGSVDENMVRAKFNGVIKDSVFKHLGEYHYTLVFYESDDFINQIYSFWNQKGFLGGYPYNDPFFYYMISFSLVVLIMGAITVKKKYMNGFKIKSKVQFFRYLSLILIQLIFFLIIPFFLARSYSWFGLVSAWPLKYDAFFVSSFNLKIFSAILSVIIIPLVVLLFGKKYCSYICHFGALAETLGDKWRELSPKGERTHKFEIGGRIIFALAFILLIISFIFNANNQFFSIPLLIYRIIIVISMFSIMALTFFPVFGGRIWCRYLCPLGAMMQSLSRFFAKKNISHFKINSFDRCIKCTRCTQICQMGISVHEFAKSEESFSNKETNCIGCNICISVCPVGNLTSKSFKNSG